MTTTTLHTKSDMANVSEEICRGIGCLACGAMWHDHELVHRDDCWYNRQLDLMCRDWPTLQKWEVEPIKAHGHCPHGRYTGGVTIDWMCSYCEDGTSWDDYVLACQYISEDEHAKAWVYDAWAWATVITSLELVLGLQDMATIRKDVDGLINMIRPMVPRFRS